MRLVLASGCFDVIHWGHILHLQAARRLGDRLIVALTGDAFVRKPGRPVFSADRRAHLLRELRSVSQVIVYEEEIPYSVIREVRPQIYVKGKEYQGRLPEQELVEELGGRVAFTDTRWSSTETLRMIACASA